MVFALLLIILGVLIKPLHIKLGHIAWCMKAFLFNQTFSDVYLKKKGSKLSFKLQNENVVIIISLLVAINFHSLFFHTMEVNGYQQMFGYTHCSKKLILCSTKERNRHRLGITWRWVNEDIIFIFRVNYLIKKRAIWRDKNFSVTPHNTIAS